MSSASTRRPTAERRTQIANAALDLVGRHGPTAFTTARVAEAVGVTSGALFRHFDSLAAILDEAVRLAIERIEATFPDPALPPTERLFAMLRARVVLLRGDPGIAWLLRSELAVESLPASAVDQLASLVARSRAFLKACVLGGVAEGGLRADVPPSALLVTVTGTVHALVGRGGVHARATTDDTNDLDAALGALRTLLSPSPLSPVPNGDPTS